MSCYLLFCLTTNGIEVGKEGMACVKERHVTRHRVQNSEEGLEQEGMRDELGNGVKT